MDPSVQDFLSQYEQTLRDALHEMPMPPSLLAAFEVLDCLAQFAEKEIYTVRRSADGQLGLLRVTSDRSPEQALAEAAILGALDHPALPKILYAEGFEDRAYVVRMYFAGQSLETRLRAKGGALTPREAVPVILALCEILQYLHSRVPPVIHRDMKPQNVILGSDGNTYLVDFGISRIYRPEGGADTVPLGTQPYAPPEQYGFMQTDARSDLYSTGMVLLRALTGAPDRSLLPDIHDKELREILRTAIALDPDDRYQTAEKMTSMLRRWSQNHRRRLLVIAGASAGALVLAGAGVALGFALGQRHAAQQLLAPAPPQVGAEIMSYEEQIAPAAFQEQTIALAVRNELNLGLDLDRDLTKWEALRVTDIVVQGTYAMHHSIQETEVKTYTDENPPQLVVNQFLVIRGNIATLEDMVLLPNLRNLTLYSQRISDLTPLTGLPLITLRLADNNIRALLPLKDIATLEVLDVDLNPVGDLRPLARLSRLRELDLRHTEVADLSTLGSLRALDTLYLDHTDARDFAVLSSLHKLHTLTLGPVSDAAWQTVGRLDALERLTLYGKGLHLGNGAFAAMPSLRQLEVRGAEAVQVSTLAASAPGLTQLSLAGCDSIDLHGIEGLSSLLSLDVSNSGISDLSPLADVSALTYLDLRGTRIDDLRPLLQMRRESTLTVQCAGLSEAVVAPILSVAGLVVVQ